jgi:anthranilate phosphoribosyltransferase
MSIARYLESIGSGASAAPALTRAQACEQMHELLSGRINRLQTGALLAVWKRAAEHPEALAGFADALAPWTMDIRSARSIVVLPSLHGADAAPMLTPLLALWLAREGHAVLVHGPRSAACGPTCGEVLQDLGVAPASNADDVAARWARREPAFLATETLCPALGQLLEPCAALGWRAPAHHVARLLAPAHCGPVLQVLPYRRASSGLLLAGWAALRGAHVMLLPGTDGEPVADPRHQPRIDVLIGGRPRTDLCAAAAAGAPAEWPVLPRDSAATTTAIWVQDVLSGERPLPLSLLHQSGLVAAALSALAVDAKAPDPVPAHCERALTLAP